MEWLLIIVLGGFVIALWNRVGKLQDRLGKLEQRGGFQATPEATKAPLTEVSTEPVEETAARAATRLPESVAREAAPEPAVSSDAAHIAEPTDHAPEETQRFALPEFKWPSFDFEDLFGRRLPIWAGGIALAAGGIFLVIYAVEQGLMGPTTRVALSVIFGILLLGLAEASYRFEDRVRDPRVRQALAGAGIATLYAAAYLAGAQYGLIGPGFAFGGLALITAGALALTSRFGLPTAVLGLVGGFATPVMVASEEANVPVLSFYLALLTAGLALTARRLEQRWLGVAGLAGGFLWGVLMLVAQPAGDGDVLAIGLYLLAIGAAIPLLLGESERVPFMRLAAGAIAAVQMGALVSLAGFGLLNWGLYGLLAAALAVLAWRNEELRPAGLLVTAVGAILLAVWPDPASGEFLLVASGLGLVLLGAPLAMLARERGGLLSLAQVSLGALAIGAAALAQFGSWNNEVYLPGLSVGLAVLALIAAGAARISWRKEELDEAIAVPVASSALLAFGATHLLLADWAEVLGAGGVTLGLTLLAYWRRPHVSLTALVWAGAALCILTLLSTGNTLGEMARGFGGSHGDVNVWRALLRWGAAALPFAALAWLDWRRRITRLSEVLLALIAYILVAQFLPGDALAWTTALAAMALSWWVQSRSGLWATTIVIAGLWAFVPLVEWIYYGLEAVLGMPMLVNDQADLRDVLLYLAPFALGSGVAAWAARDRWLASKLNAGLAVLASVAVLHIAFKQIFAIEHMNAFITLGMAERTLWQALLIGGGIAAARFAPIEIARRIGIIAAIAGLAHFTWFTLILHNPLWSEQAVGALPLANLLAPAYLLAGMAVWWLSRKAAVALPLMRQLGDAGLMVLISLWSLSELRHVFAGSVLTSASMTQTEDLLRSFAGIVLALAFLWWGSRTGQRSWRIGSLVLILIAVLKVFLVDAAGLEGLLRVASFIALGASLIAIGWVYSRQLSRRES